MSIFDLAVVCQCADLCSISSKIKRAVTDSTPGISFDPETRPAVSNLVSILAAATGREPHDVSAGFSNTNQSPMLNVTVTAAGGMQSAARQPCGAEAADNRRARRSYSAHSRRHRATAGRQKVRLSRRCAWHRFYLDVACQPHSQRAERGSCPACLSALIVLRVV
jgi:hypothetical protein